MNRSTYKEPEYGVVHAVARPWQIKAGHSIVLHKGTKDNKKKFVLTLLFTEVNQRKF